MPRAAPSSSTLICRALKSKNSASTASTPPTAMMYPQSALSHVEQC